MNVLLFLFFKELFDLKELNSVEFKLAFFYVFRNKIPESFEDSLKIDN